MAANPALAIRRHASLLSQYDAANQCMESVRANTIAALNLRRGDVVMDVCSGAGLSFAQIEARIGSSGQIIAMERNAQLARLARQRAAAGGFRNIVFLDTAVEHAAIPLFADAILFNYTHDVLQSHAALANIFNHAHSGARVAASGTKFVPWWLAPLNLIVALRSRRYLSSIDGITKPYEQLLDYVIGWEMQTILGGMGYIGRGVHPGAAPKLIAQRHQAQPHML